MNHDDRTRKTNPERNHFELEPDAGFARALAQVDFSRGNPVRERVRARVLGKTRNELNRAQPGGYWMNLSRVSLSIIGGIILLVMAVFAMGWGIEHLVPQKGVDLLSNRSVFTPTVAMPSTPSPIPATATLQPVPGPSFQLPIQTTDAWDPLVIHSILKKWVGANALVSPIPVATQKRTFYEYADGHQELVEYLCEPGTGQELGGIDRTRRCFRIEYSDETQELNSQAFSDCLLDCLRDLQTVQVRGVTGYLGWAQSVSGGNSTELHWREDGVTITIVAFGNWPWPDEDNPHRLDEMVLRLAESLGQANPPASIRPTPTEANPIQSVVTAAEYSLDGKRLNVVTTQGITVYNAVNLEKLDFIPNSSDWPIVAFSPDGSLLAIGSGPTVRLLRLADHVEIAHLDTDRGKVARLRFTPDGRSMASLVRPPGEEVYHYILELWSIPDAKLLGSWNAGALWDIAFTPDSQSVYAWNRVRMDGIYRWQIPSGTQLPVLKELSPGMLLFSPDGRLMVTYDDKDILIQNISDGTQIHKLIWKKQSYGGQLRFTPDGSRLVGLSPDGQVKVWRVADGILLESFAVNSMDDRSFMTLSPDNQTLLLSTTQDLSFYNLIDGQIKR